MLEQVKAPMRALVGPWNHSFPNDADFRSRIEWRERCRALVGLLAEGTRYWSCSQDPKLVICLRHYFPPDPNLKAAFPASGARRGMAAGESNEFGFLFAVQPHPEQQRR